MSIKFGVFVPAHSAIQSFYMCVNPNRTEVYRKGHISEKNYRNRMNLGTCMAERYAMFSFNKKQNLILFHHNDTDPTEWYSLEQAWLYSCDG